MSATTVPVTIAPQAAELINELGLRDAIEQMIEHTRQVVPDLQTIELGREIQPSDCPEDRYVVIEAWRTGPTPLEDPTDDEWREWFLRAFPPKVTAWVVFHLFDRE